MPSGLLPLFPLEVVLLPHAPLPLHVFEERYKEMIGEALRDHTEFGVVLARDQELSETGCTAAIAKVLERYADGRMDILTSGQRRFEIVRVDTERSFLRAEVSFFDDEDPLPARPELLDAAGKAYDEYCDLTGEQSSDASQKDASPSFYFVQAISDVGLRQQMLVTRSENERLRKLVDYLVEFNAKAREQNEARRLASRNGHGRRKMEL